MLSDKIKLYSRKLFGKHKKTHIRTPRVLHDRKVIFIHIPKTAGNSVTDILREFALEEEPKSPKIAKHAKAFYVKSFLGEQVWNDYFSFSFVRNPWDLMVSSYHWWCQIGVNMKYHQKTTRKILAMDGFDEFMMSKYGRYYINERPGNFRDWLVNKKGNLLVDYVGKVETISEDWKEICKLSNLPYREIIHVNQSKRKPYQEYYNDKTKEIIYDRFAWSIEKFGYEF